MAKLSKKNEDLLKAVQKQVVRQQGVDTEKVQKNAQTEDSSEGSSTHDIVRNTADTATVGVGVDLVEIERIERAIKRTPRILMRVFTEGEREYAWSKARPAVHYATFFAAREAVLKALGSGFAGLNFQDVEIAHDDNGKPNVILHGNAVAIARQQGITEIQISLSHTHQMAVASAVAIKTASSPRKDAAISPLEELARQFKELRSLLDDLGMSATIDNNDEQGENTMLVNQEDQEHEYE